MPLKKKEYSVVMEGVDALDLPLSMLRDLCDLLFEGSQRSVRLAVEGRSVARGSVPNWASLAADIRISKYASGSLDLGLHAPRLVDVAPEIFAQQEIFAHRLDGDTTAFDLLLDAAEDAASSVRESDRLDAGVLDTLSRMTALLSRGATRLSLGREGRKPLVLDRVAAQNIRTLTDETPESRIARVRGMLDTLTVSTRTLLLRADDGRLLRGFASDLNIETLQSLHGKDVVLEGLVTFRPSGDALRIDVDSAYVATPGDAIWSPLPRVEPVARSRATSAGAPLGDFFGKWPGDETDEQLMDALLADSRKFA